VCGATPEAGRAEGEGHGMAALHVHQAQRLPLPQPQLHLLLLQKGWDAESAYKEGVLLGCHVLTE